MNFARKLFTLSAALLLASAVFAQMSDQQVIDELKRLSTSGKTQEQIFSDLSSKGVTIEQLQRIKAQYETSKSSVSTSGTISTESREREVLINFPDPTNWAKIKENQKGVKDTIFGKNIFSNQNLTFQPNMNVPTPETYVLGSGDEILIDIWGNSELNLSLQISPDGKIMASGVGPIYLAGLQIKDARSRIRKAFGRIYSDLLSSQPGTFLNVTLGKTRTIQINIMGEVEVPGTYALSSLSTVFHAVYSAGGINEIGSLRDIKVYRGGKLFASTDVYSYLLKGDNSGDISLKDGDMVKVEPYRSLVKIIGEVKRPMYYEMKSGETIETLLSFAGGFKGNAYKLSLLVNRKGEKEKQVHTIEGQDYSKFTTRDGDIVFVGAILERYENRVTADGALFRPGTFALGEKITTLKELIIAAEGPKEDAFLDRVLLYRENPDLSTTVESLNLSAILNGTSVDIKLKRNDRLYVPSKDELRDERNIVLAGEVRRPGSYPFARNMSIEDLILQGGGLLESASRARVDVSRRIKNPMSIVESEKQSEVFSFALENGLIISGDKKLILQPFDIVTVRRSPGYEVQQNVSVIGEILFAGSYAKTTRDERLSYLVSRAGGVTESAYIKGARLLRRMDKDERARLEAKLKLAESNSGEDSLAIKESDISHFYYVGIDLAKAIANPGGDDDLVLREGDVLDIPTYNGTVKISGAVMYPNTIAFSKGMSAREYIENAGGYAYRAKKRPYIVFMNGKVDTGLGAKIEPGCEIIVPQKPERQGASFAEILGLSTSVVSTAAMVTTLIRQF
ncbi:MAG: capsule biosynthesis protein [Bacteroidetes bacterium HGW-Bacteroidetes-10]|nr:MAG: capsule biosynthesis protein [Bacteroidetes bacterium HGW-Bacteroidetes-10]